MMPADFALTELLNPEFYIKIGGLWLVLFIVFAETGLFIGFFLPGDSLLFISGIYAKELVQRYFDVENANYAVALLVILTALSAIIGNMLGYRIGTFSKHFFHHAKDRWYYKKKYLDRAHQFYEKHGGLAISFARFIPIVRTFVPVVAGIVEMRFRAFLVYSILGGFLWALTMQMAGHYMYTFFLSQFDIDIKKYIELIVITIIVISTSPVIWNLVKKKSS